MSSEVSFLSLQNLTVKDNGNSALGKFLKCKDSTGTCAWDVLPPSTSSELPNGVDFGVYEGANDSLLSFATNTVAMLDTESFATTTFYSVITGDQNNENYEYAGIFNLTNVPTGLTTIDFNVPNPVVTFPEDIIRNTFTSINATATDFSEGKVQVVSNSVDSLNYKFVIIINNTSMGVKDNVQIAWTAMLRRVL